MLQTGSCTSTSVSGVVTAQARDKTVPKSSTKEVMGKPAMHFKVEKKRGLTCFDIQFSCFHSNDVSRERMFSPWYPPVLCNEISLYQARGKGRATVDMAVLECFFV